jgi:predicted nucleotidyltransferase
MLLSKESIINKLKSNADVLKKYGVSEIGLFGSYKTGFATDSSDIDILVDFENDQENYDNFISLCYLLEEMFKGKKVEVVTKKGLSPYIGPAILKQVEYV